MTASRKPRVIVGMSGGVDSSVAALLLKRQGYEVIGLFMKNWEDPEDVEGCSSEADHEDVARVCEKLKIPHYAVEFVQEYRDNVFARFLRDYQSGLTPNPDILCNREIKFESFLGKAMELGADYLATGHYCRRVQHGERVFLGKGLDPDKDQSYFLYAVEGAKFGKVLFPVGELLKPEVRRLAREEGLATAAKKDSTGICFIGERKFREFLSRYVAIKPGAFRTLDGKKVGEHQGAAFYTLGQRKGLGLGGQGEPWFVVDKNADANVVFVERGSEHPALYSRELRANELNWIGIDAPKEPFACKAKVRYRQKEQACLVEPDGNGALHVVFEEPQRAVTPGQSVVFYDGDLCLGGGVITERSGR
jgi:tRNA-specific 2-thiouridylase